MENKNIFFGIILFSSFLILLAGVNAAVTILAPLNNTWTSMGTSGSIAGVLNVSYNHSINSIANFYANCTVYVGGVSLNTTLNIRNSSTDGGAYIMNISANASISEGVNYLQVICINGTVGAASYIIDNSSNFTVKTDYSASQVTFTLPASTNLSVVNRALPLNITGWANDTGSGINGSTVLLQFRNSTGGCWLWSGATTLTWGACTTTHRIGTDNDWTVLNYSSVGIWGNGSLLTTVDLQSNRLYYNVTLYVADTIPGINGPVNPTWGVLIFMFDNRTPNSRIWNVNDKNLSNWTTTRLLRINLSADDSYLGYFNNTDSALNYYNVSLSYRNGTMLNSTKVTTGYANFTVISITSPVDSNSLVINLTVVDNASNSNMTSLEIGVDAAAPNSIIYSINNQTTNSSYIITLVSTINFTPSDNIAIKNWTLSVYNSSTHRVYNWTYIGLTNNSNISALVNYTFDTDGIYTINLTTYDNLSNVNVTINMVTVDTTDPSVGTPNFYTITSSSVQVSVTGSDTNLNACTYGGGASGTLSCVSGTCTATVSSLSSATVYSFSATCTDLAGRSTTGSSASVTTSSIGSSGTGGSGGGSGSSVAGQFSKKVWSSIYAGETATLKVAEGDGIGATEVSFKVDKTSYGVTADVKKLDKTAVPAEIGGKKVHNYLKIAVTGAIKEENIKEGKIIFKVAKKWLADNMVSKDKISLYRYADNKWSTLPTKFTQEDDLTVYYSADTPGFSYFAIAESETSAGAPALVKEEQPIEEAPAVEETPVAEEAPAFKSEEAKSNTWLWVVLVIVIAAIIAAIYFWPKKKGKGF